MRLLALFLSSPDMRADVGFFQVLGFALCELEEGRARLVPAKGPELWIEESAETELKAVFSGMGPKRDPEGNPLLYANAPAATTRGQAEVLGSVYPVVDLPTGVAWYEKQLGLKEVFFDEVTAWSELEDEAGRRLVLAFAPDLKTPAMLALLVRDAAAEVARLREFDLEPIWARSVPWGRLAAYVAPGGLVTLLVERPQ